MPTDITISPLDINQFVGIGIDLPLMAGNGSTFAINYTTLDQAVANAKNLLLTNQGERVMQPAFGCDLYRTIHENITDFAISTLEDRIRSQFEYWLPYINIVELTIEGNEEQASSANKLFVKMSISLNNNKFDTRSIELTLTQTGNESSQ